MKAYLISIAAGLLVGIVYSLLGVRSPAPPMIALAGLLGILVGEQILPLARSAISGKEIVQFARQESRMHIFGRLPGDKFDSQDKA